MTITPETRADMFKRGFVYSRKLGLEHKAIPSPYNHEEHEMFFDVEQYEYEKETGQ